ncbi:hypothetical protein BG006_001822, partial [Podila minutissima]
IRHERLDLEKQLTAVEERIRSKWHVQKEYNLLRDWISRETLPKAVMEDLTKAEVYEAKDTPFDKIKEIYLKSGGVYDTDPCESVDNKAEETKTGVVNEIDEETDFEMYSMHFNDQGSEAKPKYSVLIMGKTQSGKSTLVQFVQKYADRQYEIDTSLIGTGNVALTPLPMPFVVRSNLPEYKVVRKESRIALDLSNLANMEMDDDDDYLDHISYREEEYELCEVQRQQDIDGSLSELELMFLDTPGINDTNNDDSVHADHIIKEVIRIRSFNLILFVFKYDNPLTVEQQTPLKYYAEVLKEFRSRMAFLFTHVKYENCYPTNLGHQKMIDTRHKALSRLVQGLDIEPCSSESTTATNDKDNMVNLPQFTIDFTDKRRPVQQWMIRDTLRKILHLAVVSTPAAMDTSKENIDRITKIAHPTKLTDEHRKEIRICQSDEKQHEEPDEVIQPTGESEITEEQINILLLGDVQSGKTSLVETMRLYADPNYVVKHNLINHGILRTGDKKVRVTSFPSDLPTVEIRTQQGKDLINLDMESKTMTEEDFDDLLSRTQKDVLIRVVPSGSPKKYCFSIYEGPSLNESHGNFEKNVFNIHKTIVNSEAKFHLVLFTLAPGPITAAIKSTVRVCSDIFSDLNHLFSFVHTKIDYSRLHIGNKKFKEFVQERECILWQQILEHKNNKYHINQMDSKTPDPELIPQQHIQSTSVPYLIDCDFEIKWLVRQGKTQDVVRDILSAAVQQKAPVAMGNSLMKKTPKMIVIDTSLKWRAKDEFEKSNKAINICNAQQVALLNALGEADKGIDTIVKGLSQGTTGGQGEPIEDLEVVYENSYEVKDEKNAVIGSSTMEFVSHGRILERLEMSDKNIEIEQGIGGEGHDHWMIVYRRKMAADASLDVKLYARKLVSKDSSVAEPEGLVALRRQRIELEQQLAVVEARMMDLWKVQDEYFLLREWISRMSLPTAVMEELTKAEVYETEETPFGKIKEIYLRAEGVYGADSCPVKDMEREECQDYFGGYVRDSSEDEEDEEV